MRPYFLTFLPFLLSAGSCSAQELAAQPQPVVSTQSAPQPLPLLRVSPTIGPLEASANLPLVIKPEAGVWDLSRYESLYLKLSNPSAEPVTVWARAENPTAKGATDTTRAALVLAPGKSEVMELRLVRRPENPTYAPFKPFLQYFKAINVRENTVDPSAIARVVVWLDTPAAGQKVLVESVTAQGAGVAGPVPFFPFIDKYGQYTHADWPNKIHSDADFATNLQREDAEMSAFPGPADRDSWGGWKGGPQQEATGFFYAKKVQGKWWLVDPTGELFWSYGPTGVGFGEGTPVTDRENWFEELPAPDGPMAAYWGTGTAGRNYYKDKKFKSFSFSSANAERSYGKDWETSSVDRMHRRLRNWGFNTVGNWSNEQVRLRRKTPYVVAVHYGGPSLDHIPDVFSPEYERIINERMAKEIGTSAGDPWNIGYFVDNELNWGWLPRAVIVARGALVAEATSASKQVFVNDLKAKYTGIAALNAAWKSNYASWDALLQARKVPSTMNPSFDQDCGDFALKFADKYFSTVRAAVKKVAPNNLYLGCRFHSTIGPELMQVAAKYCDVLSYNIYAKDPAERLNRYIGVVDKPFIVGEFGLSSDTSQSPWRGEKDAETPQQRLSALENYLRKAFVNPTLVGAHFFLFRDQPLSGRGDGEATLRGFVTTADTPHFDLVQLNRRIAYQMYEMRGSYLEPTK